MRCELVWIWRIGSMTHGLTWKEVLLNKAWVDVNVETLPDEACT